MSMFQDARYACRALGRQPALTLTAIGSLSVGLAAVAAAISVLDGLGFRPQAVEQPEALVRVQSVVGSGSPDRVSYADLLDLRDRTRAFTSVAGYGVKGAGLSGPEAPPEVALITVVTSDYFQTLGVAPAIGRALNRQDSEPGAPPALVVSAALWQRRFHGDPDIARRAIQVNGSPCAIVGVMPASFTGLDAFFAPDIWIPIAAWSTLGPRGRSPSEVTDRAERWMTVVARLDAPLSLADRARDLLHRRPAPIARAQAQLDVVAAALRSSFPVVDRDQRLIVVSETSARERGILPTALLLLVIVAIVVAVGCANAAGLMMGRAESRRQEMAIRVALGAGRLALVRQVLVEAAVLALGAAAGGLLLGLAIVRSLPALLPPLSFPLGLEFRFDARVVIATTAAAALTIFAFGLWPALISSRHGVAQGARTDSTTAGLRRFSLRNTLVIGQVAVSVLLLVCGTLLVRGLRSSEHIEVGFAPQRPLLLVTLAPGAAGYEQRRTDAFYRDLVDRLSGAPGIDRVSLARRIPLDPNGGGATRDVLPPNRGASSDAPPLHVRYNSVLPNYFDVMGTRIVRGRAFLDSDRADAPKVVIVNESMAAQHWPDGSAVGRRIRLTGAGAGEYQIVGIAQDGKYNQLTEQPQPYLFFVLAQAPTSQATLIVQAAGDPSAAASTIRGVLRQIDSRMPTLQMLTLSQHMRFASYAIRMAATAVGSLGLSGLLLSLVGLYSVVSFIVTRRTREIGIRVALGASPRDIWRTVMRNALALAGIGVAVGSVATFGAARLLEGSLYGVSPADPLTFASVTIGIVVVSLLAAWSPARRAMRVDPIVSLRAE